MENLENNEENEPYYCTECQRNHTTGKIYKEHLQFSKNNFDKTKTYFIKQVESNYYKIGCSLNPEERLKIIQAYNPNELTLELILNRNIESSLHIILADYCIRGEWFELPPHIIDLIKLLI